MGHISVVLVDGLWSMTLIGQFLQCVVSLRAGLCIFGLSTRNIHKFTRVNFYWK